MLLYPNGLFVHIQGKKWICTPLHIYMEVSPIEPLINYLSID